MAQRGGFYRGFQLPVSPAMPGPGAGPDAIVAAFNQAQAGSRNANQALGDRIAAGYDSVLAGQQADLRAAGRFGRRQMRGTIRGLRGANEANLTDIDRYYGRQMGDMAQDLVGRGLGNSTVQSAVQAGLMRDRTDTRTRSQNEFAKSLADVRTNWGQFLTTGMRQDALANSGLATQQLEWMNSMNIGYPDAGAYAQMAAMAGGGGGDGGLSMMPGMPGPQLGYQPVRYQPASGTSIEGMAGGGVGYGGDFGWATGYGAQPAPVLPTSFGESLGNLISNSIPSFADLMPWG